MNENQQFVGYGHIDGIRRELDTKIHQKISELDTKIDKKISNQIFCWVLGILVVLCLACFTFVTDQNNQEADKLDAVINRLTAIETLIEERENNQLP
jgi:pheromone shutdown protein TraB